MRLSAIVSVLNPNRKTSVNIEGYYIVEYVKLFVESEDGCIGCKCLLLGSRKINRSRTSTAVGDTARLVNIKMNCFGYARLIGAMKEDLAK